MMYILYKIEPRAETFDTILYYVSKKRNTLEEIVLSIWEEAKEILIEPEAIKDYINQFNIIWIPEV